MKKSIIDNKEKFVLGSYVGVYLVEIILGSIVAFFVFEMYEKKNFLAYFTEDIFSSKILWVIIVVVLGLLANKEEKVKKARLTSVMLLMIFLDLFTLIGSSFSRFFELFDGVEYYAAYTISYGIISFISVCICLVIIILTKSWEQLIFGFKSANIIENE